MTRAWVPGLAVVVGRHDEVTSEAAQPMGNPLTPLRFLQRAASVRPDRTAIIDGATVVHLPHGAEPREPSHADWTLRRDGLPRRFRSSTLRACGAGRLALEQIRQRGLQRPGANPRTCARVRRRGSRSYPQFRSTNLTPSCAQTLAVNNLVVSGLGGPT